MKASGVTARPVTPVMCDVDPSVADFSRFAEQEFEWDKYWINNGMIMGSFNNQRNYKMVQST